jgi:hypothetical protein
MISRSNLMEKRFMKRETTGKMQMRSLTRVRSLPVMMKRSTVTSADSIN